MKSSLTCSSLSSCSFLQLAKRSLSLCLLYMSSPLPALVKLVQMFSTFSTMMEVIAVWVNFIQINITMDPMPEYIGHQLPMPIEQFLYNRYRYMQQFSDDFEGDAHQLPERCYLENGKDSMITRLFKNTITNLAYNFKHSNLPGFSNLQRKRIALTKDSQTVYLLGDCYEYPEEEKFYQHFRDTIWLTYRKGIKNFGDDTGWGCMIRATQMMLAEVIKRSTKLESKEVLKYFDDETQNALSLSSICKHGKIGHRWTTANQIVSNCKEIIVGMQYLKLDIHSINDGYIVLKNIIAQIQSNKGNSHLIVIHNRVGLKNLEELKLPHLKELMRLKQFAGMLGGEAGEAMYILGFSGDQVLFLDPHYVQDSCSSDIRYFKRTPRGLQMSKLSASISIGFFVKDLADAMELVKSLYQLEEYYRSHRIIELVLDEAQKKQMESITRKDRKVSLDQFEMIQ